MGSKEASWQASGPGEAGVSTQDAGRLADRAAACLALCFVLCWFALQSWVGQHWKFIPDFIPGRLCVVASEMILLFRETGRRICVEAGEGCVPLERLFNLPAVVRVCIQREKMPAGRCNLPV